MYLADLENTRQKIRTRPVGSSTLGGRRFKGSLFSGPLFFSRREVIKSKPKNEQKSGSSPFRFLLMLPHRRELSQNKQSYR